MKLGILVVYLVAEEDERLLEIHLSQIEKTTGVPFRIYAAANRLLPQFREKIEKLPFISTCRIPTTPLRGSDEHAYYLDRLAQVAVADDATHICTFHVDSFPACPGWVEKITAELRGDCVLAGVERDVQTDRKPVTEFMLFTREFYLAQRPTFRLSESELASAEYQRYLENCPHTGDSGVGYGFKLWSQGLSWFPLKPKDRSEDNYNVGTLFGNVIFHLGGTARLRLSTERATPAKVRRARLLSLFLKVGKAVTPLKLWQRFSRIPAIRRWAIAHWWRPLNRRVFLETRDALLADPEQFLSRLRNLPPGKAAQSSDQKSYPTARP